MTHRRSAERPGRAARPLHSEPTPQDLILLSDTWPWFGNYSGYARFMQYLPACYEPEIVEPRREEKHRGHSRLPGAIPCAGIEPGARRMAGATVSLTSVQPGTAGSGRRPVRSWLSAWWRSRFRPGDRAALAARFIEEWSARPGAIGHVLYFEHHHAAFSAWRRAPRKIIATLHHPPAQIERWPRAHEDLRRVRSAIVLYQRDLDFFEHHVGRGRVAFVHHGVDTTFFTPGQVPNERRPRLLYIGINGRDTDMLQRVVRRLVRTHPDVQIDVLIPNPRHKPRLLFKLTGLWHHPSVTLRWGVGDKALRELYQSSDLLLLPLRFAGACNAIVESLASGLPVVTTDVGGVRDYGAGSIYPVVPAGDDTAMVELIDRYLTNGSWRDQVASRCRTFAEETLAWPRVASAHVRAYRDLIDS